MVPIRLRLVTTLSVWALLGGLGQSTVEGSSGVSDAAGSSPSDEGSAATYRLPPQVFVDLADAPLPPLVLLDPSRQWMLELWTRALPPISEVAQPELRLAGLRINPQVHVLSSRQFYTHMRLVHLADGSEKEVTGLSVGARISGVSWSPDGAYIAFALTRESGSEVWLVDRASRAARRLGDARPNLILNNAPLWLADSRSLLCALVPDGRRAPPAEPRVPLGPVVEESSGHAAPAPTYRYLLANAHDEELFEYYLTGQLARMDLTGHVIPLGTPGMHRAFPSPDGRFLLVQTIHRPFSYLVPFERFPWREEVWETGGALVRQIADLPLREEVSATFDSVPAGPRFFHWRDDAPSTLAWVETVDGGDSRRAADWRDRVDILAAPFSGEPRTLAVLAYRLADLTWCDGKRALVTEIWRKTHRVRTWLVRPDGAGAGKARLLFDRSLEDRYGDPGEPLMAKNAYGRAVLRTAAGGKRIFFIGAGASPEGDRPFFDAYDLDEPAALPSHRLFRSEAPWFEQPVDLLDDGGRTLLVRRESVTEPPNYFVRDLVAGTLRQVTFFPHPAPWLTGVHKEVIHYHRQDGVKLTGTLYLPAGHHPSDGPLPVLIWVYPQDFKSVEAAGQGSPSPYRFDQPGWWSPALWVLRGYAVLDDPGMPIVGAEKQEPNDTYVDQLVADADAAIDELARRGVADRHRIAIGGHSYGAFTVANLLARSHLFAAGIALSGAYNRTLTPFGFQHEERTLWQAPAVYLDMSPFLHAGQINAPILIVHGLADSNPGTDPIQSERFFNALKGLGATARLVLFPGESHSYQARESILHLLWEMDRWLDLYVKPGPA